MARLGLDLRATEAGFKAHKGRGTGRYAAELAQYLCVASDDENSKPGVLIKPITSESLQKNLLETSLLSLLPAGRTTLEQQVFLPRKYKALDVDVLHFLSHGDAPVYCSVPYFVTVLDLIPLKFPELYQSPRGNWRYRFARYLERQAILRANGIIAISEATKRDLVALLGIASEKIYVTPLAVSDEFFVDKHKMGEGHSAAPSLIRSFPAERDIILYVGGIDPRKNISFLLATFKEILAAEREADKNPLLVMAGRYEDDRQYPALLSELEQEKLGADVKLVGFVSDKELPELYRAADVLLFPSLYEGFGLPVLEAMASGLPVVAGRHSSIPEVAGDAAALVEGFDKHQWAAAVCQLLNSEALSSEYSERGRRQAARFSWKETAKSTLEAYQYFLKLPTISSVAGAQTTETIRAFSR